MEVVLIVSVPPPLKLKLPILTAPLSAVPELLVVFKLNAPDVEPMEMAPDPELSALLPVRDKVPKFKAELVALTVAFKVVVLALLVKPLVKLKVPLPIKLRPLVLLKVVGLLIVLVEPEKLIV